MTQWIALARQIATDFDPARVMIAVTGGEPLLKEGLLELFAELRQLRFPFGMVTNGQLIDGAMAAQLVKSGIGSISVSLDGPEDLNDAIRGRGSTRRAIDAVAAIQSAGFAGRLEIMSTLTRPVVPKLDATRRLVASLRVPSWRVVPVMPIGRAADRPDLVPGPADLRRILEFVAQARRDGHRPAPEFCEEGYLGERYEGEVRPFLCRCLAGVTVGSILCDGRIGACPELADAFVQGHIRTERFRDVWESRFQALRDRSWSRRGACRACGEFARCQGGSLHLYAAPGSDPLRCFHLMLDGVSDGTD